jgi:hypothetical protein
MSDAFDTMIDRQSPPNDPARIAAVIASDQRFAYFGTVAFAVRLLRLDQKIASGVPMSLRRVANILNTDTMLFQEFCNRLSKYGDKTVILFADVQAMEVPIFWCSKVQICAERGTRAVRAKQSSQPSRSALAYRVIKPPLGSMGPSTNAARNCVAPGRATKILKNGIGLAVSCSC